MHADPLCAPNPFKLHSKVVTGYMRVSILSLCQQFTPRRGFHLRARRARSGHEAAAAAAKQPQGAKRANPRVRGLNVSAERT